MVNNIARARASVFRMTVRCSSDQSSVQIFGLGGGGGGLSLTMCAARILSPSPWCISVRDVAYKMCLSCGCILFRIIRLTADI